MLDTQRQVILQQCQPVSPFVLLQFCYGAYCWVSRQRDSHRSDIRLTCVFMSIPALTPGTFLSSYYHRVHEDTSTQRVSTGRRPPAPLFLRLSGVTECVPSSAQYENLKAYSIFYHFIENI